MAVRELAFWQHFNAKRGEAFRAREAGAEIGTDNHSMKLGSAIKKP